MTAFSQLLGLPAELRNHIYGFVVCADPVIRVTETGHIIQPNLAFTSKQVRNEFLQVLDETLPERADTVEAIVLNYDFAPLRIALNMPGLDDRTGEEAPALNLKLQFYRVNGSKFDARQGLKTWIRHCETQPDGTFNLGTCAVDMANSNPQKLRAMSALAWSASNHMEQLVLNGQMGKHNGAALTCAKMDHALAVARMKKRLEEAGVTDLPENVSVEDLCQSHYYWAVERRIQFGEW
ncbi:hypothetical protein LTR85_001444 [Meristemomyces frigidus]|nr:hypothetical protein LTR85_001444 [Meristemomyces frigidus]